MNFVLVNPQYLYVSNPVNTETILSYQEENQHEHFLYKKIMQSFVSNNARQRGHNQPFI